MYVKHRTLNVTKSDYSINNAIPFEQTNNFMSLNQVYSRLNMNGLKNELPQEIKF